MGVDPSLTATGLVYDSGGGGIGEVVLKTRLRGISRMRQLRDAAHSEVLHNGPMAVIVIEGPAFASSTGQAHERGGLWWLLMDLFFEVRVPVLVIPPTNLKKFATGTGTAKKDRVVSEVTHRTGRVFDSNDVVDAMVLYCIGRFLLGLPHPLGELPGPHRAALDKIELPKELKHGVK